MKYKQTILRAVASVLLLSSLSTAAFAGGAPAGGFANGGSLDFDGGMAFYTTGGSLSSCAEGDTGLVNCDTGTYINACGERVFFLTGSKIMRSDAAGSGTFLDLKEYGGLSGLLVQDGYLYFTVPAEQGGKIYVCPADAAEPQPVLIAEDLSVRRPGLCMLGGNLYYSSSNGLVSCRPDGTEKTLLSPKQGWLFTDGEALYLGTEARIVKFLPDGSEQQLLFVQSLVNEGYFTIMDTMSNMNVRGGWIYYLLKLSEYYELRMIRTDGSDAHRVCDVCHVLDTVRGLYVSGESGLVSVVFESGGETRIFCAQPDKE